MRSLFTGYGDVAGAARRVLNRHHGMRRVRPRKSWTRGPAVAASAFAVQAIAATVAAAAIPASASVPASTAVQGWSVAPSPNPVIPTGQLFWVSCPAANLCVAVGTYVK